MVHKKVAAEQGVRIVVGTYRKSDGRGGAARHGRTGKKAMVHQQGKESVLVKGATLKELRSNINAVVRIPPSVTLANSGETCF